MLLYQGPSMVRKKYAYCQLSVKMAVGFLRENLFTYKCICIILSFVIYYMQIRHADETICFFPLYSGLNYYNYIHNECLRNSLYNFVLEKNYIGFSIFVQCFTCNLL